MIKYEDFLPKKAYYCSCLKNTVDEILKNDIRSYSDIILAVTEYCQGNSDVYCLRVQEKTIFFFLCQVHMIIKLLTEAKFDCTSADEKDLVFDALQKRYCRSCVRHYCELICSI